MSASYSILTTVGLAAFENAATVPVVLETIAIGSGSTEPTANQTVVEDQKWVGAVADFVKHPWNTDEFTVSCIIPAAIGGFTINTAGLFDQDGRLLVVAKVNAVEKVTGVDAETLRINLVIKTGFDYSGVGADILAETQASARSYVGESLLIFSDALESHEDNWNNPHQVSKSQVGLGSVDNFPTASQAEAEAGTVDNRFMSPVRVAQAISKLAAAAVKGVTDLLAPLANPIFTGVPKAPTATLGDSSVQLATTEFVKNNGLQWRLAIQISDPVATLTEDAHAGGFIEYNGPSNGSWTVFLATDKTKGKHLLGIRNLTNYTLTLTSNGFNDGNYQSSTLVLMPGEQIVMWCSNTRWNLVSRHGWAATIENDPTFSSNGSRPASTAWLKSGLATLASQAGFAYSFSSNGYFKFPSWFGGFIFQWGTKAVDSTGWVTNTYYYSTTTYPVAFPNWVYGVVGAQKTGLPATGFINWSYENANTSAFTIATSIGQLYPSIMQFYWFAFGR